MTTVLFIWVMSQGVLQPPVTETFYTVEACAAAARKAENALLSFPDRQADTRIVSYCSTKRLTGDK